MSVPVTNELLRRAAGAALDHAYVTPIDLRQGLSRRTLGRDLLRRLMDRMIDLKIIGERIHGFGWPVNHRKARQLAGENQ